MGLLQVLDTLRSDLFHTYYSTSKCDSACGDQLGAHFFCSIEMRWPACRLLQQQQPREVAASCTIQRCARGFLVRIRLRRILRTAVVIQRYWRGYLGRKRFNLVRTVKNTQLRQAYFDTHATNIQRYFRGYYSRKYVHSCFRRRRYVQEERPKHAGLVAQSREETEKAEQYELEEMKRRSGRDAFQKHAKDSHHLLSTHSHPGIFRTPYQVASGTVPTIDGTPIEQHLRTLPSVQALLPKARGKLGRHRLPFQLELLQSELMGDYRSRTLQSLPHFNRNTDGKALDRETCKRVIRALHGYAFDPSGTLRTFQGLPVPSLRCQGAYALPVDLGRKAGPSEVEKRTGKLFKNTFNKHTVPFGATLKSGEGV